MKLFDFKDQFTDHFFDVELSTGKILRKVVVKFPSDNADDFILLAEDDLAHIVAVRHIVKITPHINGEVPHFSFT